MGSLDGKAILITGSSRRIGRALALACAAEGAELIIHYNRSGADAIETQAAIQALGGTASVLQADLATPDEARALLARAFEIQPLHGLVNNAAVFGRADFAATAYDDWQNHLAVNLTAPFLLTQAFARLLSANSEGRVVNLLDWRAMKPGSDHFAYTISKAALAAMTRSMALAVGPRITVNGLALGAFLPPEGGPPDPQIKGQIPAGRWGTLDEAGHALVFLLSGPAYITGEVIHLDGGRHLL